jgi:hypothetical protein
MADLAPNQSAKQMLERQLEQLGSLYNAGVRSQNFREWRQNTLTCIQRIWSADPAKSERFRRIPFSPPMGRPGEREVREYYERGCGEAGSLLKGMIAEISTVGLANQGAAASPAPAPGAPGAGEDDFPTVELPGGSAMLPPRPRLKDLLGFAEAASDPEPQRPPEPAAPAAAGAPPLPPPAPAAAPAPPAATGAPPLPAPAAAPAPPPAMDPDAAAAAAAQALAELETHGFFAPPGHTLRDPAAAAPPAPPAATSAAPRIVVTGTPPPVIIPPPAVAPAAPASETGSVDPERVAEELLRATSAIGSLPRRTVPDRRATPREVRSPIPLAIAALALEVDALGVPDGHRARARAVLLDLSRQLDSSDITWSALKEAMSFVMEFPALGRRMVPLLLPYLDRAA